jgi:hypothetical protein
MIYVATFELVRYPDTEAWGIALVPEARGIHLRVGEYRAADYEGCIRDAARAHAPAIAQYLERAGHPVRGWKP